MSCCCCICNCWSAAEVDPLFLRSPPLAAAAAAAVCIMCVCCSRLIWSCSWSWCISCSSCLRPVSARCCCLGRRRKNEKGSLQCCSARQQKLDKDFHPLVLHTAHDCRLHQTPVVTNAASQGFFFVAAVVVVQLAVVAMASGRAVRIACAYTQR